MQRLQRGYDPQTHHVIQGLDAGAPLHKPPAHSGCRAAGATDVMNCIMQT
jgi:hypothetical protein